MQEADRRSVCSQTDVCQRHGAADTQTELHNPAHFCQKLPEASRSFQKLPEAADPFGATLANRSLTVRLWKLQVSTQETGSEQFQGFTVAAATLTG